MRVGLTLIGALAVLVLATEKANACDSLLSPAIGPSSVKRTVVAEDLVRLRDIGPSSIEDTHAGVLALSPDGRAIAFQIRQADLSTNSYCLAMFVLGTGPGAQPIQIDAGGEVVTVSYSAWGFAAAQPPGIAATITPQWSPDGLWVAYLRRDAGKTQVWRARADGTKSERVTNLPFDVEAFTWGEEGQSVIVSGRPAMITAADAIAKERAVGFHFDDRFMPSVDAVPRIREPVPRLAFVVSIGAGSVRPATSEEEGNLEPVRQPGQPVGVSFFSTDGAGDAAWTEPSIAGDVTAPTYLHIRSDSGRETVCTRQECTGIMDLWAASTFGAFVYLRRDRGASSESLYRFAIGNERPRKLLETDDVLASCRISAGFLYCIQEGSLQPRRIIRIDLETGMVASLFDPNPEFATLQLGSVKRLRWTNAYGIETFGDLVLPPGHLPGQKHPLIVVGYNSRGFLRGGTGDDYPIQLLAAHGYAVLSYQTPTDIGYFRGAKTWADMNRLARIGWSDFRSTTSAVENGIDAAIAQGAVDPNKIGLTGLSYGSTTAQFALVNSKRYSAAVLSNCCEEAAITNMLVGPAMQAVLHDAGYPSVTEDGYSFWKPISFKLNASSMNTPLLLQLPDSEYLGALEAYTALWEKGQPVDMFVFPNETHIKWQPLHRMASYQRTIDWFDFWLRDVEDLDPAKAAQYEHWRQLRAAMAKE